MKHKYLQLVAVLGLATAIALMPGYAYAQDSVSAKDKVIYHNVYQDLPHGGYKVAPAPRPKAQEQPGPDRYGDMIKASLAIPTGHTSSSALLLEKMAPAKVRAGQAYEYILKVTNLTGDVLTDVVVTDHLSNNFKVNSSVPQMVGSSTAPAKWDLGKFGPHESKLIQVEGEAGEAGEVTHCGAATYNQILCLTTDVVNPAIQLTRRVPASADLCTVIPITYVVKNTGTGVASNVQITETLPSGLQTLSGKTSVVLDAGSLAEGQSREFTVDTKAIRKGSYTGAAKAAAAGGITASSQSGSTTVTQAALSLSKSGTDTQFVGRSVTYSLTVKNTGDARAEGVVLTDNAPQGARLIEASDGGRASGSRVVWSLGNLEPGAFKSVNVSYKVMGAGRLDSQAVVSAKCADDATAGVTTQVQGVPAVLLEVIDVEDPIEVGQTVTYVVTVTNQGSASDRNIRIVCELEENLEYVSSSGPTQGRLEGRTVQLAPLATLEAGAQASWRVVVKGVKAGDVRFKVQMNTEELTRPVDETESTHVY